MPLKMMSYSPSLVYDKWSNSAQFTGVGVIAINLSGLHDSILESDKGKQGDVVSDRQEVVGSETYFQTRR